MGSSGYFPGFGEAAKHPADEARMRGVVTVLERLGSADGPRVGRRWDEYAGAARSRAPALYEMRYPQSLIDALADRVVAGCQRLGLRPFIEGRTDAHIPRLLQDAWERFLSDPEKYSNWESHSLHTLWARLGFDT